jgi:hypothetical protein
LLRLWRRSGPAGRETALQALHPCARGCASLERGCGAARVARARTFDPALAVLRLAHDVPMRALRGAAGQPFVDEEPKVGDEWCGRRLAFSSPPGMQRKRPASSASSASAATASGCCQRIAPSLRDGGAVWLSG